jgi:hypothetical protein
MEILCGFYEEFFKKKKENPKNKNKVFPLLTVSTTYFSKEYSPHFGFYGS